MKRVIGRHYDEVFGDGGNLRHLIPYWPFHLARGGGHPGEVDGSIMVQIPLSSDTDSEQHFLRLRPLDISSIILQRLRQDAEIFLELAPGAIKKAVIAHPAYFGYTQRLETLEAARLAGLDDVTEDSLISEPMAAVLNFHHTSRVEQRGLGNYKALVFDLGAGTFDITVIEVRRTCALRLCTQSQMPSVFRSQAKDSPNWPSAGTICWVDAISTTPCTSSVAAG